MTGALALLPVVLAVAVGASAVFALPPPGSGPPFIVVLGVAQDAGYPQAGCRKACCAPVRIDAARRRFVASIAIVDPMTWQRWIIDATPDFREQLALLNAEAPPPPGPPRGPAPPQLSGILLTHAHIGHYTGLMFLGHESIGAREVPVHAMPRMREFLSAHGPWDQLVRYENISLRPLEADVPVKLNGRITVTPFRVPHREEYSEAVGFRIDGPNASVLYIPDIDKWERFDAAGRRIEEMLAEVDVAYLDGTFFADGEIPGRDMAQIPHPFIDESMTRFAPLPAAERAKVRFIHLNHTNPALDPAGAAARTVRERGFRVAEQGERVGL